MFYRSDAGAFKTRSSIVQTLSRPLCLNRVTFTVPNFASAHARNSYSPTSISQLPSLSSIEPRRLFPAVVRFPPDASLNDPLYDRGRTIVNGNNSEIESSRRMTMSSFSSKRIFRDTRSRNRRERATVFYSDVYFPLLYSRSTVSGDVANLMTFLFARLSAFGLSRASCRLHNLMRPVLFDYVSQISVA